MFATTDKLAYISTEETITIVLEGKSRTVQIRSKAQRNEVVLALERFRRSPQTQADREALEDFFSPLKRTLLKSDKRFEIDGTGGILYLTGTTTPVPEQLSKKILDFIDNDLPVDSLVRFWESCLRNPHYIAVTELFNFLEKNHLPITDDGAFLGYKKLLFVRGENRIDVPDDFEELSLGEDGIVRAINGSIVPKTVAKKYKQFIESVNPLMVDVHSKTIRQKVGEVVKIERVKLNELELREACGYGLHIGAFSYNFSGDVRVLCKVFPEDVIACNENEAKLRTCEYQIISFVDSAKEIKELLVNLDKNESDLVNGEYDDDDVEQCFPEDSYIICVDDEDEVPLSRGKTYFVLDADEEQVLIVDNDGDRDWYDADRFELAD